MSQTNHVRVASMIAISCWFSLVTTAQGFPADDTGFPAEETGVTAQDPPATENSVDRTRDAAPQTEDGEAAPAGPNELVDADEIAAVYLQKCARCHGKDGQGVADGDAEPFRLGGSVVEAAKLIVETMPEENPDDCVGEEAERLAKYIQSNFRSGEASAAAPRISRLTVDQYRNAMADVIGRFTEAASERPRDDEDNRRVAEPEVPGLRGEYFQSRGMNKADRLGHYRSDTRIDFDFGVDGPVPSISADQFAVIWQGGLVADHTGHYEFRVRTENGARLYLNLDPSPSRRALRDDSSLAGQQAFIDAWVGSGKLREMSGRIFLLGGRTYPIRLEFFKYLEKTASITLEWKPPHGVWSVLDYNHTSTHRPGRVFVCQTSFPADDRSLGFERGNSVSPQWQTAIMNGAIEAASEVVSRLPYLIGIDDEDDRVARAKEFVLEFARVAYREELSDSQREVLIEVTGNDENNLEAGVRRAVIMVLLSPQFLYPDLTPDKAKPSPETIASRLSFGLWDSIPDGETLEAARRGKLSSFSEIESHARRMLRDQRAKTKMRSFFRSWLELEQRDLSKDKKLFPDFDEAVVADLRRSLELFIERVVWSRDSDYRQLLLADYLMLNEPLKRLYSDAATAAVKPSDGEEIKRRARQQVFGSQFQPVSFPSERRSGVLTHPYLLSAYAYHNHTSPIHRGVFLTRNIVGRALSPPPMAIAFKDEDFAEDLTMREKVTQLTRDTACQSCHSVINPLGFTLEHFDAVGRWRITDNDKPVQTSSQYTTASGDTLQLSNAREVAELAVKSPLAHRAFVTHVFEHVVKRSPRQFGPELLDQLTKKFVEDDFNIQKLWARVAAVAAAEGLVESSTLLAESTP